MCGFAFCRLVLREATFTNPIAQLPCKTNSFARFAVGHPTPIQGEAFEMASTRARIAFSEVNAKCALAVVADCMQSSMWRSIPSPVPLMTFAKSKETGDACGLSFREAERVMLRLRYQEKLVFLLRLDVLPFAAAVNRRGREIFAQSESYPATIATSFHQQVPLRGKAGSTQLNRLGKADSHCLLRSCFKAKHHLELTGCNRQRNITLLGGFVSSSSNDLCLLPGVPFVPFWVRVPL